MATVSSFMGFVQFSGVSEGVQSQEEEAEWLGKRGERVFGTNGKQIGNR